MMRYFVCSRQKPASRPNGQCEINLHDPNKNRTRNITVRGLTQEIEGIERIIGIEYCSSLDADNIESAEETSRNDFDFVASVISFLTGVSMSPVRPYVVHTNDKGMSTHEFLQHEYLETPKFGVHSFDPIAVDHVISGFNSIKNSSITERIASSLKFYRKAQATNDPVERFLLLWISVEYLDYALVKGMANRPVRVCPKCRELLECGNCGRKAEAPITAGLQDFADRMGKGTPDNLTAAIELRNELFHRETDLGKAGREAAKLNVFLREFYISTMRHLMSLSQGLNIMSKFVHTIESIMIIRARVILPEPGELRIKGGKIPHYEGTIEPKGVEVREDGGLSENRSGSYSPIDFPEGAVFKDENFALLTIGVKPRNFKVENTPLKN